MNSPSLGVRVGESTETSTETITDDLSYPGPRLGSLGCHSAFFRKGAPSGRIVGLGYCSYHGVSHWSGGSKPWLAVLETPVFLFVKMCETTKQTKIKRTCQVSGCITTKIMRHQGLEVVLQGELSEHTACLVSGATKQQQIDFLYRPLCPPPFYLSIRASSRP